MSFILILVVITLVIISAYDLAKSIIPNSLILVVLGLAFLYYILNLDSAWWKPLAYSIGSFLLFFLLFVITGESILGGGDMKLISISFLLVGNSSFDYIFFLLLWLFTGEIFSLIRRKKYFSAGPYLSLALINTLFGFDLTQILMFVMLVSLIYKIIESRCVDVTLFEK